MTDWITLEPKLRPNSRGLRHFTSFLLQLATPGYDRLSLDKLRQDYLARSEVRCGVDRKPLRVLVAVLCDLKSKGWQFRYKNGIGYAAGPEETGGSILEQKDRVRTSLPSLAHETTPA